MIKSIKKTIEVDVYELFCDICNDKICRNRDGEGRCYSCCKTLCMNCALLYESASHSSVCWTFCPECIKKIQPLIDESEKLYKRSCKIDAEIENFAEKGAIAP